MSDCPHSDVNWNLEQAEELENDVFTIPGVCEDCRTALTCQATIDDWWEEEKAL